MYYPQNSIHEPITSGKVILLLLKAAKKSISISCVLKDLKLLYLKWKVARYVIIVLGPKYPCTFQYVTPLRDGKNPSVRRGISIER